LKSDSKRLAVDTDNVKKEAMGGIIGKASVVAKFPNGFI
jgi:hypothetical protein